MSKYIQLSSILLLSTVFSCSNPSDKHNSELGRKAIALEIMARSGTCTLITLDSTGFPRARIMDPFDPGENFVIWFGTNPESRKVEEIKNDPRVTINYYEELAGAYVSLYGKAEIITDSDQKSAHWKPEWKAYYPHYPEGYCLIKFTPDYLELISEKHGLRGDSRTWKPIIIDF